MAFEERLDTIYPLVPSARIWSCQAPRGAFYLFPNVKAMINEGLYWCVEFTTAILEEVGLALITELRFGAPENVRLS